MKGIETIHAIRHPFRLALDKGIYVDRFVYSYILFGKHICLIDTGVADTKPLIQEGLKKFSRSVREISFVLLTHAHPDHIGGALGIMKNSAALFAAHSADLPWIENVEKQFQERPILNFFELVEGPVPVKRVLREGDTISLEKGKNLKVFETPGHSRGSLSFFLEEEGALFSGDAIPAAGTLPIYVNPGTSIESIRKLQSIQGIKCLFSSWHDPISGDRAYRIMEDGIRYIEAIDAIVQDLGQNMPPEANGEQWGLRVLERLGIKAQKILPMVMTSLASHLKKEGL
ncbi:MAG: MBL fold metallo-hydrolase [Deltaproteobacteria bacterium]|nr:MBL fold metallo-hydrolase [Deltaproteobacteria bacterium]